MLVHSENLSGPERILSASCVALQDISSGHLAISRVDDAYVTSIAAAVNSDPDDGVPFAN